MAKAMGLLQIIAHQSAHLQSQFFIAFIFELMHEMLHQRLLGKIVLSRCANQWQSSPKNFFDGVVSINMKIGFWHPRNTVHAQRTLFAYNIAPASCTYMREQEMQERSFYLFKPNHKK